MPKALMPGWLLRFALNQGWNKRTAEATWAAMLANGIILDKQDGAIQLVITVKEPDVDE